MRTSNKASTPISTSPMSILPKLAPWLRCSARGPSQQARASAWAPLVNIACLRERSRKIRMRIGE
jgi:hypothetical protein